MSGQKKPNIKTVPVRLTDPPEDPAARFDAAAREADKAAGGGAFLLAWKDRRTGSVSPSIECCGCDGYEGWESYALSRGADLLVEVDGGDYAFMFLTG